MDTEQRGYPPIDADERGTLLAFLDWQRNTLRIKVAGLDARQLATPHPPSDMTLGGLVKHLAFVENWWVRRTMGGHEDEPWASVDWRADADWDWHSAVHDTSARLVDLHDSEVARADAVIASIASLDAESEHTSGRTGGHFNLRWVLVHLVEEYARHNGHADLIRESIDGAVGQ